MLEAIRQLRHQFIRLEKRRRVDLRDAVAEALAGHARPRLHVSAQVHHELSVDVRSRVRTGLLDGPAAVGIREIITLDEAGCVRLGLADGEAARRGPLAVQEQVEVIDAGLLGRCQPLGESAFRTPRPRLVKRLVDCCTVAAQAPAPGLGSSVEIEVIEYGKHLAGCGGEAILRRERVGYSVAPNADAVDEDHVGESGRLVQGLDHEVACLFEPIVDAHVEPVKPDWESPGDGCLDVHGAGARNLVTDEVAGRIDAGKEQLPRAQVEGPADFVVRC